jgi:hypothetical protein
MTTLVAISLTAMVLLGTSAELNEKKVENTIKSQVFFVSLEKENPVIALSEANKQAVINAEVAEQARIAKEKVDALAIEKAKQDELDKQAEAIRVAKVAAEKVKQAEASRLAQIAANKAKQAEIDRIAAERADVAKQAKIAENYRIAKAASDKAEQEALRLAKVEADWTAKIEVVKAAKIEIDRRVKAVEITKEEGDRLTKIEDDKLVKIEADRLAERLGLQQTVIGAKLANFLNSADNISSVLNRAVELHGGDPSNTCVYFSSEAMRRLGVTVPVETCNTRQYLKYLRAAGWVSTYDIKKLTPGSICFTTADWAGFPTHTFVFMGWVSSGNYTLANVADNQGNTVHVRNMGATKETDEFAFFMHN